MSEDEDVYETKNRQTISLGARCSDVATKQERNECERSFKNQISKKYSDSYTCIKHCIRFKNTVEPRRYTHMPIFGTKCYVWMLPPLPPFLSLVFLSNSHYRSLLVWKLSVSSFWMWFISHFINGNIHIVRLLNRTHTQPVYGSDASSAEKIDLMWYLMYVYCWRREEVEVVIHVDSHTSNNSNADACDAATRNINFRVLVDDINESICDDIVSVSLCTSIWRMTKKNWRADWNILWHCIAFFVEIVLNEVMSEKPFNMPKKINGLGEVCEVRKNLPTTRRRGGMRELISANNIIILTLSSFSFLSASSSSFLFSFLLLFHYILLKRSWIFSVW